jgi:hypothetical protein
MAGVSTTIAAVAVATASEFCTDEISNGCLEIFKKITSLLIVTVLFLFTFFNLILDAPRIIRSVGIFHHERSKPNPTSWVRNEMKIKLAGYPVER